MKTSPVRILLVEDDAADARAIAAALRTATFAFELAVEGTLASALQRLRAEDPDVVLLDLQLPDGSGPESVRRLQEAAPTVPVLALMDFPDGEMAANVVRAGAQDCLVKGMPSVDSMLRCVSYAIDRKNLERQRLRLVEIEHERGRLRDALAAQEQLLGVVGHELRTPLASLRALSEVLIAGAGDAVEREGFLRAVNREVVRMAGIVNDLLEAARLNSGAVQWKWGAVSLAEVCGEALESIRPLVDAGSVRLGCTIEPPGLAMRGDASALRRLVLNLLSNAQKHTTQGSILVQARTCGQDVELEVRDTGEGIRPEIGERLGTPFALNAGNAGDTHVQGTGLGIVICKGIVAAHGGSMAVVSRRDGGTAVTVRLRGDLPRPAPAGDVPIRLEIEAAVTAPRERGMTRILIVDDMAVFREPIAAALRAKGYETVCAENGRQALGLVKSRAPDLILLDVAMPVMNGLEYLKAVRDDPTIPRPPVILLTAVAEKDYVVQAAQLGVREYMLKSRFSLEDLLGRIGRCLEEARSAAAPEVAAPTRAAGPATPPANPPDRKAPAGRAGVLHRLAACQDLKAFSPAVTMVLEATASDGASIDAIAGAIKQDQAITIRILKLANSALYKRGRPCDSIDKAVMRIGSTGIRQAVLNIGVIDRFSSFKLGNVDAGQFWEHALGCGLISSEIAAARGADRELAFTAGLLHDVGRVACAQELGGEYEAVWRAAQEEGLPLELAEQRTLGIDHAEVMGHLLEKWNFPRDLVDPIVLHHNAAATIRVAAPGRVHAVATLALANRLCHALCLGNSGNETIYPTEELCEVLGVDSVLVARIVSTARKQTEELQAVMLAASWGQGWVDRRQRLRSTLDRPLHPIFVGRNPERDGLRIFCQQLADQRAAPPNVGLVHIVSPREQATLSQRYEFAESQASGLRLPLVILSPKGDLALEAKVMAGRHCEYLATPVHVSRFLGAMNRALGAGAGSAAA